MRRHLTYANVAATLALVFAMSGGAYAASKFLITSTKQIKPSVLSQLKGKAGAAGAQGPAGPAGLQGAPGAPGAKGETGAAGVVGKDGATGKEGAPGKEGKEGKEGSPWTAGGTLPKGKTETGTWRAEAHDLAGVPHELVGSVISFPIPVGLEEGERGKAVYVKVGEAPKEGCEGTTEAPTAPKGTLCIYVAKEKNVDLFVAGGVFEEKEGFGRTGTMLEMVTIENTPDPGLGQIETEGTWAVTAP
ncbi:MAG TPA: hypothetical protein VK781_11005 [Solirubrobacteraceae bacterium]|nr:hypothetical protein [Solirubrobacteraceae bacterium]